MNSAGQFYYSDLTASLYLSSQFALVGLALGTGTALANYTINFDVTNASPSSFSVSVSKTVTFKIPTTSDSSLAGALLEFQSDGGVLGPFGPFTMGGLNKADLRITSVCQAGVCEILLTCVGEWRGCLGFQQSRPDSAGMLSNAHGRFG